MQRAPMSIEQQADFIEAIVRHCTLSGGEVAAQTYHRIEAAEVEDFRHLAARLRRMAPYERQIKEIVLGR